jgi:hypothetical protein
VSLFTGVVRRAFFVWQRCAIATDLPFAARPGPASVAAALLPRNAPPPKSLRKLQKALGGQGESRPLLQSGVLLYIAKHFHDLRRTAARNMIRAGVSQSIAMRITGHATDAMFHRYDITDNRDKVAALEAARNLVNLQPGSTLALVARTG